MIWFTSDTHFDHDAVIRFSARPWPTVTEMNNALIERWNAVVGPHDEVWHLGDFCWTKEYARFEARLNGRINLVFGNHDLRRLSVKEMLDIFDSTQHVKYLRYQGLRFWLNHYAQRTWPKSNHGTFHLFGHSHGDLPRLNRSMDVGVDAIPGYRPVSIDEVVATLESAPSTSHHASSMPESIHD